VELYFASRINAFLWTIENSLFNSREFFALIVQSLSISFDQRSSYVPRIIMKCPSIKKFTMYITHYNESREKTETILRHISDLEYSLHTLRPIQVQIQLHHCFRDPFSRFYETFFQSVTHLALMDDWEYWTRWSDHFFLLPALTHLSLDLRVGSGGIGQGNGWRVCDCVWRILKTCRLLRVCIIRLLFDSSPNTTRNMLLRMMQERGELDGRIIFVKVNAFGSSMARSFDEGVLWSFGDEAVNEQLRKRSLHWKRKWINGIIVLCSISNLFLHQYTNCPI